MLKVVIKEFETGEVVKEVVCEGKNAALKVERGLNINLNHDKFYTMIEPVI